MSYAELEKILTQKKAEFLRLRHSGLGREMADGVREEIELTSFLDEELEYVMRIAARKAIAENMGVADWVNPIAE